MSHKNLLDSLITEDLTFSINKFMKKNNINTSGMQKTIRDYGFKNSLLGILMI